MDLAPLHPIQVHFVIAFLVAGVLFRLAFLAGHYFLKGRLAFASPAAAGLLLAGTLAAWGAVESGEAASGDAEAIPGAAAAVEAHEEWAHWTFRVFVVICGVEGVGLLLRRSAKGPWVLAVSGALGVAGLFCVYQAGEHGGRVVYSYAGGVGTRTGDPQDVSRLFLAGVYQQSLLDRIEGRAEAAARLVELLGERFPGDLEVQLLRAESQLLDAKDPAAATVTLGRLVVPKAEPRLRLRHGLLLVDALIEAGQPDAARAALQNVGAEFPQSPQVKERVSRLQAVPSPPPATVPAPPSPEGSPAPN